MEKHCDLHSHSNFSDGTCSPTELVKLAEQQGLLALALTDHNTSQGLKEFMEAGRNSSVITVPGCEFTTEWHKKEVHIVGLFIQEKEWPEVEDFMELAVLAKHNSNVKLIDNLQKAGYEITYEEAAALTDAEEFNRTHVARVLLQKGYIGSVAEGFDNLLKPNNGFYEPARRITSMAAINFIKVHEAVPILAHPFLNLTDSELLEFLPEAKTSGLIAMETHYSEFDPEMTQKAIRLAERFELKQSGGSDYHGKTKPGIELGTGRGDLFVPYDFYEDLLASVPHGQENA